MRTLTLSSRNHATISLDHYEYMVDCGAFAPPYDISVELMCGAIVEKGTGARARFSLEHYEHMIRVGAFDPPFDIPVELLEGNIVMMSPIGEPHSQAIIALNEWSYEVVDRKQFVIRIQMPIRIPATQTEPEPDVAWVRRTSKRDKPPEPDQVALLIEVAESSLVYDREVKLPGYAVAGIPEVWIVNIIDEQIEVYRKPIDGAYQKVAVSRGNAVVHPLALPTAILHVSRLFGE